MKEEDKEKIEKKKTIESVLKEFNAGRKNKKNGAILYTEREREEFERGFNSGVASKQKEMHEFKIKMADTMLEHESAVNNSKFNEGIEAALKLTENFSGLFTTYLGLKTLKNEIENLKKKSIPK